MVMPLEALAAVSPVAANPCVADDSATLVLAGDFCTQSSFLGAYASARAAAETATRGCLARRGRAGARHARLAP